MTNNPWLSIWCRPRATIQRIVLENPKRSLWLLAGIYGFSSLLNLFQTLSMGHMLSCLPILLLALVLSPFWGYLVFGIWSLLVKWTGKWLRGKGDFAAVRAAYAWSCVPLAVSALLWLALAWLLGRQLFLPFPTQPLLQGAEVALLFSLLMGKVVLAVWSLVIYLNALAEVQQFSILRAIANVILAALLLSIVLAVLWIAFAKAIMGMGSHSLTALQLWHESSSLTVLKERL